MQQTWLIRQEGNRRLVLYILGWASTPNAVHHITPPPGYDVLAIYNYTDIEALSAADFAGYDRIYLFAWSFGVWVAEHIAAGLPLLTGVVGVGIAIPAILAATSPTDTISSMPPPLAAMTGLPGGPAAAGRDCFHRFLRCGEIRDKQ